MHSGFQPAIGDLEMASLPDFPVSRRDITSAVATEGRYGRWERASGYAAIAVVQPGQHVKFTITRFSGVIAIAGISHTIALDAALLQRYPDANIDQEPPQQPRWRWFARACQLKHGVPCVLLIEADTGYLLLVSHLAESAFEFGLDLYDALLMSLDIHPDVHKVPHDGLFSFDQNPDAICWRKGSPSDLALQRRLNDAAQQLAAMSPAQGHVTLANLNKEPIILATGEVLPDTVMRQRLNHYARLWLQYAEHTYFIVHAWNAWRKKKPWVEGLIK